MVSKEGDPERMGNIPKKASRATNRYDTSLQMFVEEPQDPDLRRLSFMRWLVENNRLEHPVVGPASGELAALVQGELPLSSAFPRMVDGSPAIARLSLDPRREI